MSVDPFAILGLPRRFDLADDRIESAYLTISASMHPDLAGHGTAVEGVGGGVGVGMGIGDDAESASRLAAASAARDTLRNPESRAGALLEALGGPAPSADRSLPPGFLPEIMRIREELEAALESNDADELARLRGWARERRAAFISGVGASFERLAQAGSSPSALGAIRTELNAWRYIERMIEQMSSTTSARTQR